MANTLQLFEYDDVASDSTRPDWSLVIRVAVPVSVSPTSLEAWLLNLGRNRFNVALSNLYTFRTNFPAEASSLMTLTNSVNPSAAAPLSPSFESWQRRASSSIHGLSTASRVTPRA